MLRFENVATPATALTVRVPDSLPPAGFVAKVTITAPMKPGATSPDASNAVTCTAGVITAPACVVLGCWVKRSCVAGGGGGLMVNGSLTTPPTFEALASSV